MVFTGITATEAQIDQKSGINVSTSFTDTMKTQSLLQAEADLNRDTMFDCTGAFATWDVKSKHTITSVTASQVAIDAINYDRGSIGTVEANERINVLYDRVVKGTKALSDKEQTTKLAGFTT